MLYGEFARHITSCQSICNRFYTLNLFVSQSFIHLNYNDIAALLFLMFGGWDLMTDLVTSIHENWFCARCMNTSKPAGEGAIIMQTAAFLLVAL